MRVLAIRGRNLASLEGDFEVDFEAEPLASAGIFAITGPTGAGKSTLLDAMCLALFNSLPRLASAGSGQIGIQDGESISAGDPRAVLRHRCGEGHAEVDFVGRDRVRYRARWAARRARNMADGALQGVAVQLTRLDTGERIGGHNTETLQEIRDRVGLTEQQFARAVLLAQGDFDAFVRANPNDRAQLLEKLTGTEIYARLGVAARGRAEGLRVGLAAIEQRIAQLRGLDDAARAEAESRLETARQGLALAEARVAELDRHRLWQETAGRLRSLVLAAEATAADAQRARDEAEPRRARLGRRAAAAAIIVDWRIAANARGRVAEGRAAAATLEGQVGQAVAQTERLDREVAGAREVLDKAEAELEAMRPELQLAGALDTQIEEAGSVLEPLRDGFEQSNTDLDEAVERVAVARSALEDTRSTERTLGEWLGANSGRRALADREEVLAADLAEHGQLSARRASFWRRVEAADADLAVRVQTRHVAEALLAVATTDHEGALEVVVAAEEAAPAPGAVEAAIRSRNAIAAVESPIEALQGCVRALIEADARVDRIRSQLIGERETLAARRTRQETLSRSIPALQARREEARRSSGISSAAASEVALRLREVLVPGEPCPVCGSREHELSSLEGLVRDRVDEDQRRVEEIEQELLVAERAVATESERVRSSEEALPELADRLTVAEDSLAAARAARDTAETALAGAATRAGLPVIADTDAMRDEVTARLAAADAEQARLEEARSALDAARLIAEERRQTRETGEIARQEADADERAVGEARSVHAGALAAAEDGLARLERELDAELSPFLDWREEFEPAEAVRSLASEWREREAERGRLATALPALADALHAAELGRAASLTARTQAEDGLRRCEERLASVSARRMAMLGGRPTAEVAGSLAAALAAARDAHEEARARSDAARTARTTVEATLAAARQALADGIAQAERLDAQLATALRRAGVSSEEVSAEAAAPEDDIEQEREALHQVDIAVQRAAAELDARRGDLIGHEATPGPDLAEGDLAVALSEAELSAAAARAAAAEASLVIRQDDQAREATAALRRELAEGREGAAIWFRLEELIGDATGGRFRKFAQGLTLDRLLAHSNARLLELKPRYELQRGFGGEMLIQVVDHDLAGEVRGLHNLSGGERFLVSLALALGLSEMSTAEGLRIESLFIDEGFGALDSASLGSAIAMLEQLHATGRRVGVISHIEEVKERIPVKVAVTPISRGRSSIEVLAE